MGFIPLLSVEKERISQAYKVRLSLRVERPSLLEEGRSLGDFVIAARLIRRGSSLARVPFVALLSSPVVSPIPPFDRTGFIGLYWRFLKPHEWGNYESS